MPEAPAQSQSGATNWEAEKARLEDQLAQKERQLSGLSNERNSYRQRAEAWEKRVGAKLGNMVRFDANGMPIDVEEWQEPVRQAVPQGAHPLTGVMDNPAALDTYYTQLLQSQGFLTAQQAQAYAQQSAAAAGQQAYQAARGDMLVMRTYDRLTAQEPYKDLSKMDSKLSQRTAQILQERGMGQAMEGAKGFDEWRYRDLYALQNAADSAQLQLDREVAAAEQSAAGAQANQQAAGLSVGQPGAAAQPVAGAVPIAADGGVDFSKMRQDTESRAAQFGVTL